MQYLPNNRKHCKSVSCIRPSRVPIPSVLSISHSTRLNHASILDLLYTTLFHRVDQAWGDPNVRRSIFKSLSKILIPHSASGLFFPEITRDAIRRYGPKRILERCTTFLNHGFILGTTSVIAQLAQVSTAHEPLFAIGKFHVTLLSKYWEWIKNPEDTPEDDPESVTFAVLVLIGMYCPGFCLYSAFCRLLTPPSG